MSLQVMTPALLLFLAARNAGTLRLLGDAALRTAGDAPGHEFHGNQWSDRGGAEQVKVDVHSVGGRQTYHLSREATLLANHDDFVWEHDLLPSMDGLRPAGISDTANATKAGAAKALNALAEKSGVTKGFAVEIISKDRGRVGLATVMKSRVNDKDYPDFLKAAADYMGEKGLSTAQEKTLGKWLGFSKTSTKTYLDRKRKWDARSASAPESAIHVAADKHLSPLKIAVMYAFLMGRRAYKSSGIDAATAAVKAGLLKALPAALLPCYVAGMKVGAKQILRTAGSADQPRDEQGRWSGGGVLYHGTSSFAAEKIRSEGLKAGVGKGVSAFGGGTNPQHVNLTTDKSLARFAASLATDANPGSHGVVIEVRIPKADSRKLRVAPTNSTTYLHEGDVHTKHLTFIESRHFKTAAELRTAKTDPKPPIVEKLKMRFDVTNPEAVKWAERHAAELAKGLSETTEQNIRDTIARITEEGGGVDEASDEIFDAVGDEARAEMIARTEIMTAANEGQRASWSDAVDDGLLPSDSQRQWIATAGCCKEICEGLDGQTIGLDDEYTDDNGDTYDGPPAHPNCRCTEGIVGG